MSSNGVVSLDDSEFYIEVQYPDDPTTQVLVLSSPTLDDLKAAIHSNTDLFLNQDVEILQKNNGKLRNLTAVPKIVGAMIQKSTFEEMACFHVRPKLSRTQSAPEQNQPIPTNARTQNNPPAKAYHAFLSYQWNCQHIVQNIYKDLTEKHDMEVWMDVKDMKGSISDAMAEGIDMSHTFVPVLTLDYQKSENCLLEIRYAKDRKKAKVPIRLLKPGDDAKGEVFAMTAGLLYVDLAGRKYGSTEWNTQIEQLAFQIRHRIAPLNVTLSTDTALSQAPPAPVDALKVWLNPVDCSMDLEKHAKAYVPGTRKFYVEKVNQWLLSADSKSSVLWLNGGAGLGKSVIAWLVSQNLPQIYVLGSIIFCHHDDVGTCSPARLVATMVYGLCQVLPSFKTFCKLQQAEDESNVLAGEFSIFQNPLDAFKKLIVGGLEQLDSSDREKSVLLVIDALDECGLPDSKDRRALLELLSNEGKDLPPFVRIFTTGRPEQDIFHTMRKLDSVLLIPDNTENRKDMDMVVKAQLSEADLRPSVLDSICTEIFQRSSGIFQFARLACDQLKRVPAEKMLEELQTFNSGVDGVYERFFRGSRVDGNSFRLVMKIVLPAKEPLTQDIVAELLDVPPHVVGQVLVQVHHILDMSDEGKIKLMHKTLADHLVSSSRCADRKYYIHLPEARKDMVVACLRTMLQHASSIENKYEALIGSAGFTTDNPAAQYAFKHWQAHLVEAGEAAVLATAEWQAFCEPDKFGAAALCAGILHGAEWLVEWAVKSGNGKAVVVEAGRLRAFPSAPLYEAARRGLALACDALISFGGEDVNCRGATRGDRMQWGEKNRTPLIIAAKGGHADAVAVLLRRGADFNLEDSDGKKAQDWGCRSQILEFVKQAGVDVSATSDSLPRDPAELPAYFSATGKSLSQPDEAGNSPLHIACDHGYLDVVKWLLEHGANAKAEDAEKRTPLFHAVRSGHLSIVETLTLRGADVNAGDNELWTPLHVASRHGRAEIAAYLIAHGANVNAETVKKTTPLFSAARNGHVDCAKLLVTHGVTVDARNKRKWTPLMVAAMNGHLEFVKCLLDEGAYVNAENSTSLTALHTAAQNGHLEVVKQLLSSGANANAAETDGWTPLHFAAKNGHVEAVRCLLQNGASPTAATHQKWTPLHLAAQNEHADVVQALCQPGGAAAAADPNAVTASGWTALHLAAQTGRADVCTRLLQHGASTAAREPADGWTPLHVAAQNGHAAAAAALVRRGAADPNARSAAPLAWTPLHVAARHAHAEVVRWLLDTGGGADVTARTAEGDDSAVGIAARFANADVVEAVLARGGSVEWRDAAGNAALHAAVLGANVDTCRFLLEKGGAGLEARNAEGMTPFLLACQVGSVDVLALVVRHGADVRVVDLKGRTGQQIAVASGRDEAARWVESVR